MTKVFWNTDHWLPVRYNEGYFIYKSIYLSLNLTVNYHSYHNGDRVYGFWDENIFTDESYYEVEAQGVMYLTTTKGSAHERFHLMLVEIVLHALLQEHRCRTTELFIVVTKLSQDSAEIMCRIVASLSNRGFPVLFAVPEVDVDEAQRRFGISVWSKQSDCGNRIPVLICPDLFDREDGEQKDLKPDYFIEPSVGDEYTKSFAMPTDVDTCVFWDLEDYPLPTGLQLGGFYENLVAAVSSNGCSPPRGVPIYAYTAEEDFEFYEDAGIRITLVPKAPADKVARLAKTATDLLLWKMDNRNEPRALNLVVILKTLEEDLFDLVSILSNLRYGGYNVFLALPDEKLSAAKSYYGPLLSWEVVSGKRKSRSDKIVKKANEKRRSSTKEKPKQMVTTNRFEILSSMAQD